MYFGQGLEMVNTHPVSANTLLMAFNADICHQLHNWAWQNNETNSMVQSCKLPFITEGCWTMACLGTRLQVHRAAHNGCASHYPGALWHAMTSPPRTSRTQVISQ